MIKCRARRAPVQQGFSESPVPSPAQLIAKPLCPPSAARGCWLCSRGLAAERQAHSWKDLRSEMTATCQLHAPGCTPTRKALRQTSEPALLRSQGTPAAGRLHTALPSSRGPSGVPAGACSHTEPTRCRRPGRAEACAEAGVQTAGAQVRRDARVHGQQPAVRQGRGGALHPGHQADQARTQRGRSQLRRRPCAAWCYSPTQTTRSTQPPGRACWRWLQVQGRQQRHGDLYLQGPRHL